MNPQLPSDQQVDLCLKHDEVQSLLKKVAEQNQPEVKRRRVEAADSFGEWLRELGLEEISESLQKVGLRSKLAISLYSSKEELLDALRESGLKILPLQADVLLRAARNVEKK